MDYLGVGQANNRRLCRLCPAQTAQTQLIPKLGAGQGFSHALIISGLILSLSPSEAGSDPGLHGLIS